MVVILTQDVPQIGQKNTLHNVKRGFYFNFLLPRGYAKLVNMPLLNQLEQQNAKKSAEAEAKILEKSEKANKLLGQTVKMSARASEKGSLFKSIAEKSLMTAIKDQFGIALEKSQIDMEPIKKIGNHSVKITMGEKTFELNVHVEAKSENPSA